MKKKTDLTSSMQGFQLGLTSGGHFGQNAQKLHENFKINILVAKQWRGNGGGKPIFWLVEGYPSPPPSPSTTTNSRRNPGMFNCHYHNYPSWSTAACYFQKSWYNWRSSSWHNIVNSLLNKQAASECNFYFIAYKVSQNLLC